jgi:hypothetical protein
MCDATAANLAEQRKHHISLRMRVASRIRKCLRTLGLAVTSERKEFVHTYLLLRAKYPDTVGGIVREEDAMKYLMHEILAEWLVQRHRLRFLIERWTNALEDQDAITAHRADEHIAWNLRAVPHTARDSQQLTASQEFIDD